MTTLPETRGWETYFPLRVADSQGWMWDVFFGGMVHWVAMNMSIVQNISKPSCLMILLEVIYINYTMKKIGDSQDPNGESRSDPRSIS